MHLSHSLWTVAALCITVRSGLTNFTLDDTSPVIAYTPAPLLRCSPDVCASEPTVPLHNGTSSTVEGAILIPFIGSAMYVYLGVTGTAMFNLDGMVVGDSVGGSNNEITLAYHTNGLPDVPHLLMIYSGQPTGIIQFDYAVFSHNTITEKSHRGAIIGGVVGGVAVAAILLVGAVFLRRRHKHKRISTRGVPLGDHWPGKPSIELAEIGKGNGSN
ncbi:hypothetical protein C8R45DRAFT_1006452 [Mycena sanguinolenta]|nr:hypothetical protein C8R45DRAFT_1006452 [Mycena sanguinolenta]